MQESQRANAASVNQVDKQARIEAVEAEIAALKARWPAHSVPAVLWQELEELEDELSELKAGA